jgi:tetratricopeptide (TPR) repeat protein
VSAYRSCGRHAALARGERGRRGRLPGTEPNFRRALSIQEKELTASHVNTLVTLERLALVLRSQAKYQEAEPLYRRAIAIHERRSPEENIDLANIIDQYVILLRRMKRVEEVEQWAARALRIRDKAATKSERAKAERPSEKLKAYK